MNKLTENSIVFPNLHITLYNVGDHVDIFGFPVMFYGIVIALGMLAAGSVILHEAKRAGFKEDDILDVILWGILCGIIGARIYYVIFSWNSYRDDLLSVLNIRQGGLAIYGGMAGALLAVIVVCRRKNLDFFAVSDCVILGVPVGQIFGRWGNFFNREAFGGYCDGLFEMRLPVTSVRQNDAVTSQMMDNLIEADGIKWICVHPTFLYESLWSLGVFLILYFFVRKRKRWDGEIFFSYLFLYGAGRIWIEGLRTDQLLIPVVEVPVSQCIAAVCIVVSTAVMVSQRLKNQG